MTPPQFTRPLFLLCLLMFPSLGDTVVMKNGDHLTGEIKKLSNSHLAIKLPYSSTIDLDWKMVSEVSTDKAFEVDTDDGGKLVGTLRNSKGALSVETLEAIVPAPLDEVVSMHPVEKRSAQSFWERLDGGGELGYSLQRGNNDLVVFSANVDTRYRGEKNQFQANYTSLFTSQDLTPNTNSHLGTARYDRYLNSNVFAFLLASLQRNDRQVLNLRTNIGGGLGYRLINTPQSDLAILGGFSYVDERYRRPRTARQTPADSGVEAVFGVSGTSIRFSRIQVFATLLVYPSLYDEGRFRGTADAGIRIPLIGHFSLSVRGFDFLDTHPPLRIHRNDGGLITGFGVSF